MQSRIVAREKHVKTPVGRPGFSCVRGSDRHDRPILRGLMTISPGRNLAAARQSRAARSTLQTSSSSTAVGESASESGKSVAPSLVFGLEGPQLVEGRGPPRRARPAVLRRIVHEDDWTPLPSQVDAAAGRRCSGCPVSTLMISSHLVPEFPDQPPKSIAQNPNDTERPWRSGDNTGEIVRRGLEGDAL